MTTESTTTPRYTGMGALVQTAVATVALGLLATLVGALVSGSAAAYGALIGTALVVAVFLFGTFTVNAVATILPSAALLVALLTYTLQVLAMGLAFASLSRSGLLDQTVDRTWLGGTVIAGTLMWTMAQVVLATRARIPVYDLPEEPRADVPGAPSLVATEGGER